MLLVSDHSQDSFVMLQYLQRTVYFFNHHHSKIISRDSIHWNDEYEIKFYSLEQDLFYYILAAYYVLNKKNIKYFNSGIINGNNANDIAMNVLSK